MVEHPILPQVDPSLLECPDDPTPPSKGADDNAVGNYMLDVQATGNDCRDNLHSVANVLKRFLQEYGALATVVP